MDAVLRATAIYIILFLIFRLAGKRALSQITTFDFVLLLVIGETTQQALLGNDFSVTNSAILIISLVLLDLVVSLLKQRLPVMDNILEGTPLVVVKDGKPIEERMKKARVGKDDILEAARQLQGLERMEQVKYAVLERTGGISIVPKQ